MAAVMGLTEKTVKNYVSNLLLKLGMQCRTEAAGMRPGSTTTSRCCLLEPGP